MTTVQNVSPHPSTDGTDLLSGAHPNPDAAVPLTSLRPGDSGVLAASELQEADDALLAALGLGRRASLKVCKAGNPWILQVHGTRIGVADEVARRLRVLVR